MSGWIGKVRGQSTKSKAPRHTHMQSRDLCCQQLQLLLLLSQQILKERGGEKGETNEREGLTTCRYGLETADSLGWHLSTH